MKTQELHRSKNNQFAVVFIDIDETIYPGMSVKDLGQWLLAKKLVSRWIYLKIVWWLFLRKLGRLDDEQAFREGVQLLKDWPKDKLEQIIERAYTEALRPQISTQIRKQVNQWRDTIGPIVITTESIDVIAKVFAADLGGASIIATQLKFEDGISMGEIEGPVLQAKEKVAAMRVYAKQERISLEKSLAVGSRAEDIPFLKATGQAAVINPDRPTRLMAEQLGWEIISD